ncbi:triose-phosphate isomerase [Virgibacillus sp. W0181]|uniref:triose-phosphate isomerase n=1 Tax=Virgibacillus sp. W0181 TaxID=3391581 RepID=UPI003F46363C
MEKQVESIVRQVVEDVLRKKGFAKNERRQLVIANWKMNMTLEKAEVFLEQLCDNGENRTNDVVICPPYTLLYPMNKLLQKRSKTIGLGAQNLHTAHEGAHTGEISAAMLKELDCQYVIVGHSERRAAGETDGMVHEKIKRALEIGLNPVICVGETIEQREQGFTNEVVNHQLLQALEGINDFSKLIIAYEPVWAIGTGRSASPDEAQTVHEAIRLTLSEICGTDSEAMPILYGGSVKPDNAGILSNMKDIDGFLVGGASLVANDFQKIVGTLRKGMDS